MAEQYIIQAETLMRMASALRTVTGSTTSTFTPAEMIDVVAHLSVEPACSEEIIATVNDAGYLVIDNNNAPDVDFETVNGLVGTWVQGGTGKEVPIYAMTAEDNAVAVQIGGSGSSYETTVVSDPGILRITKNSARYCIDPNCLLANSSSIHTFRIRLVYSSTSAGTGIELPELTNEGTASELFAGKELIDDEGNVVTGTFTIDNELSTQDTLISQIQTALAGKASASEPVLQTKTVTPTTSVQNVVPDSGYDGLSKVTVNAIPSKYEDVGTETNAYTSKIASLETAVTALEEELAGKASGSGGSGGGSIPTYTLTIESDNGVYSGYACTVFRDGAIAAENTLQVFSDAYTTPHTIENVVCNSLIAISPSYDIPGFSITNGSLSVPTGTSAIRLYIISATGGSNVTLRIYDDD